MKKGADFVYLNFEAPDECGHRNEPENKVRSIELIDEKVLPVLLGYLDNCGEDYKIMVLPDHPTPIVTMTHARDPVPFMIYHKKGEIDSGIDSVNELTALWVFSSETIIEYEPRRVCGGLKALQTRRIFSLNCL